MAVIEGGSGQTIERPFPVWKTIELGNYASTQDLSKGIINRGFGIDSINFADYMLEQVVVSPLKEKIDLVQIAVSELGFKYDHYGFTREKIYARALELGLGLVPAEVGPQLRLQYVDQPKGKNEWMLMAMEPIPTPGWPPVRIFGIANGGVIGPYLHGHGGELYDRWRWHIRWVFAYNE
jgi:hypothetical protein